MSEVTAFLATQSAFIQAALYLGILLLQLCLGGIVLTLVVDALDRLVALVTSDPEWQPRGEVSKEETLLVVSVLLYGRFLLSIEPPLRALASVTGNALFTALVLAPIAGAVLYGMRETRTSP